MAHEIRVVIAEDNEDLRAALVAMLESESDIECVGQTGRLEAVEPLCVVQQPIVVVLDIELRGESSLSSLPSLRERLPSVRFIMYSGHENPHLVKGALAAGASAYVMKSGEPEELLHAIRSVFSCVRVVPSAPPGIARAP